MTKRKISKQIAICMELAVALTFVSSASRAQDFKVVGPGGGGAMFHATISPHDPNEVLVACDMTGSYISHDGGKSWRMFNLRGPVRFFAFDPVDPHTMYAGTQALWRSTRRWRDPGSWSGPAQRRSAPYIWLPTTPTRRLFPTPNPMGKIVAFAIDPANSRTLFASAVKDGKAGVFLSKDFGVTWEKLHDLQNPPQKMWIDPNSDKTNRDIYVAGKDGVTVRSHGQWQCSTLHQTG